MLKKLIVKYIFKNLKTKLKGAKRWLVILALIGVLIAQSLSLDLGKEFEEFAAAVTKMAGQ